MDISVASQYSNIRTNTSLLSQELRYVSEFEGRSTLPWAPSCRQEDVEQNERNNTVVTGGTYCFISRFDPPGPAILPWADQRRFPFGPPIPNPARYTCAYTSYPSALISQKVYEQTMETTVLRDTDHRSAYLSFDFDVTETLSLRAEARWTDETTDNHRTQYVQRPIPSRRRYRLAAGLRKFRQLHSRRVLGRLSSQWVRHSR